MPRSSRRAGSSDFGSLGGPKNDNSGDGEGPEGSNPVLKAMTPEPQKK